MVKAQYRQRSVQQALDEGRLTPLDAELIEEFTDSLRAKRGISQGRVDKLTFTLVGWRRFIDKPFEECREKDLIRAIPLLRDGRSAHNHRPFKQNTISDFIKILKQFFTWLIRMEYSPIKQYQIDEIKAPSRDTMVRTAEDILTEEEVKLLIQHAKRDYDRAFIAVHYEGGFRFGELSELRWRDVKFDEYGAVINTNFKTGLARYVRLILSTEYLAKWRSLSRGKPNDLVFANVHGNPLTHAAATTQINRIASRSGLAKRITPHLLRHSRITHLVQQGMQESVIKKMMWGSPDSRQLATYLHLTGVDVDNEVLRTNGIEIKGKQDHALKAIQCPRCSTIYSSVSESCPRCGITTGQKDEIVLLREKIQQLEGEMRTRDAMMDLIFQQIEDGEKVGRIDIKRGKIVTATALAGSKVKLNTK
jgi:Site-specific recombinase XerD